MPFCHAVLKAPKPKPTPYPHALNTLGDHIRRKRFELELLQKDVARQIGVDEATIWNWENNATIPEIRFVPRIIEFLGYDPLPPVENLAERLKAYRMRMGLSRKKLAEHLGIDPGTLGRWESRRGHPSRKLHQLLAEALNSSVSN